MTRLNGLGWIFAVDAVAVVYTLIGSVIDARLAPRRARRAREAARR
jgi:hypothetical protein